jgi:4-carboxymuconolactone decarboxylase
MGMLLVSPDVAETAQALGESLRYRSIFGAAMTELAIVMIARHLDCAYEWSVHARLAREAGVADEIVSAINAGVEPIFADSDQALMFSFVDGLLRKNDVPDALFERFRTRFGERGVVEVTALMGYYTLVGHLLNAVRFAPNGGPPLKLD